MKRSVILLVVLFLFGCNHSEELNAFKHNDSQSDDSTSSFVENIAEPELLQDPDFRNTKWGMSKEEVKASEKMDNIIEDDNIILISTQVASYTVQCSFIFEDDKLISGFYDCTQKHSNDYQYYRDYLDLKDKLRKIYGKPAQDIAQWYRDLYKNEINKYGFAVSLGDAAFTARWYTTTTDICLMLTGDNYECKLTILYLQPGYMRSTSESNIGGL